METGTIFGYLRYMIQSVIKYRKPVLVAMLLSITQFSYGQTLKGLLDKASSQVKSVKKSSGSKSNLSNADITEGLKQALQVGTQNAAGRLSAVNGYLGNSLIKIVLPPEASSVESTMREFGMGTYVDKAITSMNRAAEDAASKAVPIFVNAITQMTIQDGLSILQGSNDAATQYLKTKTTASLTAAFTPVIKESLGKVDATKYWSQVFTLYNRLPTTRNKINPDLVSYVTDRALNGLFVTIAQEEGKIRVDPAAQVTDLLKKVFGSH